MANQAPSTPVRVPASAAGYTNATLDPDLRSQINSILINDGLVTKIQDHLLHALHAHQSDWPTAIQTRALSLLRSGEVTTFPALFRRVMDDVRHDTAFQNQQHPQPPATSALPSLSSATYSVATVGGDSPPKGTTEASDSPAATTDNGSLPGSFALANGMQQTLSTVDGSGGGNEEDKYLNNGTGTGIVSVLTVGCRLEKPSTGPNHDDGAGSLAVPQDVIEEALRVTRECLGMVCEIEGAGRT